MNIRIVSLFLAIFAFLFFCCGPLCQSAQAIVGVDDAIIAILIAALAAVGITFATTGGFDTASEYLESLLQEYAESRNMSVSQVFSGCQVGTNSTGKILLNNRFVVLVQTFGAWLKTKFTLQNNDVLEVQGDGVYVAGFGVKLVPVVWRYEEGGGYYVDFTIVSSEAETFIAFLPGAPVVAFNETGTTVTITKMRVRPNGTINYDIEESYVPDWTEKTYSVYGSRLTLRPNRYACAFLTQLPAGSIGGTWNELTIQQMETLAATTANIISAEGVSINTGTITLPDDDSDYTEGDGAILDVGATWGSTFDDTVEIIVGEIDATGEVTSAIEYEENAVVEDQVEDTPTQQVSQQASDYQVLGLQDVFPFCIPFDIYSFFECLAADPVAPVVNWRFYVPGICDETITLDLSQFNTVAQIVRTMELLAFIVGLALVTREKFLRG